MSYNIYLTRRKFWSDDTPKNAITKKQFLSVIAITPGLRKAKADDASAPVSAELTVQDSDGHEVAMAITLQNGNVRSDVRIVPLELFDTFLAMAKPLNATIQGEDGETYTEADRESLSTVDELNTMDRVREEEAVEAQRIAKRKQQRANWKTLLYRIVVVCILALSTIGRVLLPIVIIFWYMHDKQSNKL